MPGYIICMTQVLPCLYARPDYVTFTQVTTQTTFKCYVMIMSELCQGYLTCVGFIRVKLDQNICACLDHKHMVYGYYYHAYIVL